MKKYFAVAFYLLSFASFAGQNWQEIPLINGPKKTGWFFDVNSVDYSHDQWTSLVRDPRGRIGIVNILCPNHTMGLDMSKQPTLPVPTEEIAQGSIAFTLWVGGCSDKFTWSGENKSQKRPKPEMLLTT